MSTNEDSDEILELLQEHIATTRKMQEVHKLAISQILDLLLVLNKEVVDLKLKIAFMSSNVDDMVDATFDGIKPPDMFGITNDYDDTEEKG